MTKTFPVLVTLVVLGLGTTAALAQATNRPALPTFAELDADQSGSVTLQDFQAYVTARMTARQDADIARLMERAGPDGRLDEAGLRAGLDALRTERRAAMGDQMGHGRGDRAGRGAQQGQMGERMFARIDANDDGSVDAAEYEAFSTRMAERMAERMDGHRDGHGDGHGEGRRGWWN